ncbi:hypothetical protein ACGFIU_24880 [Rhodococcus oryzae]|uniref:hypothetical protein n=1 Tax=Rhodococcus oryzae TaxID=2571143 RepID=UPI00371341B8
MTARKSGSRREPGVVPLLAAILEHRPNLPDAACIGQHRLFDLLNDTENTIRIRAQIDAERLCRGCPHTTRCPESLTARKATA